MSVKVAPDDYEAFEGASFVVMDMGASGCGGGAASGRIGIGGEGVAEEEPRALLIPSVFVLPNEAEGTNWEETRFWIGEKPSKDGVVEFPLFGDAKFAEYVRRDGASPPPLDMAIEHLFLHILMNELREDPSASPTIMIENLGWDRRLRRRYARKLFKEVGVPAVGYLKSTVAIALAVGSATAVGVDLGHTGIRVSLITNGHTIEKRSTVLDFGGKDLIGKDAAEKLDALFDPSLISHPGNGLSDTIVSLLSASDLSEEEKEECVKNVVVGGGLANLEGLGDVLQMMLEETLPGCKVTVAPNPSLAAFVGAVTLSEMGIACAELDNYLVRGLHVGIPEDLF
eukprot:TRINITY_DN4460_c0_g1_i1.p1 TRINITY_DN4460_c0_g1~~TRINITY_DN4460_c0_g1_i1.p1  ORF type:complete len:354 (+),score=89.48 TRINITY_DN4460_c0_g1_i1:41-1063(+)